MPDSKSVKKKSAKRTDAKIEVIILSFFNKCDHVTLNKLVNFKPRLFKDYDFGQLLKQTTVQGSRVDNLEDLTKKTELQPSKFEQVAQQIEAFRLKEGKEFGLTLQPRFSRKDLEDIDKVVVLDSFHGDTAWCVRSAHDNLVTDVGFQKLNLKGSYNHVNHHTEIARLVDQLPESEVYLVRSNFIPNQAVKYAVSQSVTEAVLTTVLNERHRNKREDKENYTPEVSKQKEFIYSDRSFENRVFMWKALALNEFYDVTMQGDMLSCANLIRDWYKQNDEIVDEWGLTDFRETFFKPGSEQIAVCTLISDAFCRCLKKPWKKFPSAYS